MEGAPYDVFLSFNFLEHQPDPNGMLECIYNNLADDGYGLITVPSLEYILEHDSYYELMRDHIAYYSKGTLSLLLEKNGFEVLEYQTINRDTHEFIVRKRQKIKVDGLLRNYVALKKQLQDYVKAQHEKGHKVAIWGASHQSFTAISTTDIQSGIEYIIDSAPFKQWKYVPASHCLIVPPSHFFEEPVQSIIIIAPGYTEEIQKQIKTQFGEGVEVAYLKAEQLVVCD